MTTMTREEVQAIIRAAAEAVAGAERFLQSAETGGDLVSALPYLQDAAAKMRHALNDATQFKHELESYGGAS